ncbi:MAG: rRNA maturation RNase YbeY [Gammaproteobacteria bacterium]|nr:rRNA maturation RNase YbeY [Gammaproteobacteria bacterium]
MNQAGIDIDVQYAVSTDTMPDADSIRRWAASVLKSQAAPVELVIRIVDEAEMTALNRQYRGKDGPTNVLSFSSEMPPEVESAMIGDIVICAPVVMSECVLQNKEPDAHWAHLVIHGVLHLLGYEHDSDDEAQRMESVEVRLLGDLGFADPYREMA